MCAMDPIVFCRHTSGGNVIPIVYVDDILVTWSDTTRIAQIRLT